MHSRHLACLRRITGAELLIGVRVALHNLRFQHFVSPFAGDQWLGATQEEFFEPEAQQQLWSKVAAHGASIWVLLQDHSTDAQLGTVGMLGARLSAQKAWLFMTPPAGVTQNGTPNQPAL